MPFFAICVAAIAAGCMTTTRVDDPAKSQERRAVEVWVYGNGTLALYGNPIERDSLVKRLLGEEDAGKGRAVLLRAKEGAKRSQLFDLREYLVDRRIFNVSVVTVRNAEVSEGDAKDDLAPRRVFSR